MILTYDAIENILNETFNRKIIDVIARKVDP